MSTYLIKWLIDWLIGILLISRSGLVEENAIEVIQNYGVHVSSAFFMCYLKSFLGK